jgi:sodium/bile acid cotransporter 7
MTRPSYIPDNFTLSLIATVTLASLLPASGTSARVFEVITTIAISLLFFLHGSKLSREALLGGITHWRLHLLVAGCTFIIFPLIGFGLRPLLEPLVTPALYTGILYLCVLPSTVQSAIALVGMAQGNVSAAICSASASTLIGVFLTPVLVNSAVAPGGNAVSSFDSITRILLQLMLPFVIGHLLRPWIGAWVKRRSSVLKFVDQGSILLVVYTAFSAAVINGLWKQVSTADLGGLIVICAIMLALVLTVSTWLARKLGFDTPDVITVAFCGSQKSLASGVPMAKILFASQAVGAIVLPLMLFHQLQLMVCALLARRYAARAAEARREQAIST